MQHLDTDDDKEISLEEAFAKPDLFLKSQVTFFGQIYQLKNLRSEVFHLPSSNTGYWTWTSGPDYDRQSQG